MGPELEGSSGVTVLEKPPISLNETESIFDQARFQQLNSSVRSLYQSFFQTPENSLTPQRRQQTLAEVTTNITTIKPALLREDAHAQAIGILSQLLMPKTAPEIASLTSELIFTNLTEIEKAIKAFPNSEFKFQALSLIINFAIFTPEEDRKQQALNIFGKHLKLEDLVGIDASLYEEYIVEAIKAGNSQTIFNIRRLIWSSLKNPNFRSKTLVNSLFSKLKKAKNYSADLHAEVIAAGVAREFGIDFFTLKESWKLSCKPEKFNQTYLENFRYMVELEARAPGSIKYLYENYGIIDYSRYPMHLLIKQYKTRDTDLPYGLVLYPRNDHNGAFYKNANSFNNLNHQLGQHFVIRFAEASSKRDVAKTLIKLNRKYGPKHKISFAIIGGHGTQNSIQFGGEDNSHSLYLSNLTSDKNNPRQGRGIKRVNAFFEPHPTIILNSCSTGTKVGIGQKLSEVLDAEVVAPNIPTSIDNLSAQKKLNGGYSIYVEYHNTSSISAFKNGQQLY